MSYFPNMPFIDAAREYSVRGDGTGDQTIAINAALTAAGSFVSKAGRATVILPAGNIVVSSTLTIPPGVIIRGNGKNSTVLNASVPGSVFVLTAPGLGSGIMDLGVKGTVPGAVITDNNISGLQECSIERINIEGGSGGNIVNGVVLSGSGASGYYNRVKNCRINFCRSAAVSLIGSNALGAELWDLNIGGSTSLGYPTNGVAANNTGAFSAVEVNTLGCQTGFFIQNCGGAYFTRCGADTSVTNNWFINVTSTMVTSDIGLGIVMLLNGCWASNSQGAGSRGYRITNGSTSPLHVIATGCQGVYNNAFGLSFTGNPANGASLSQISIAGGLFTANDKGGSTALGHGIYINNAYAAVTGVSASNNIGAGGDYGVFFDTGAYGRSGNNIGVGNSGGAVVHIAAGSSAVSANDM